MPEFGSSWLVQRLEKPHRAPDGSPFKDNPFSFGGGYKNGGLTDDAMTLLRGIFAFDYMGAAEFEFGAVPQAFAVIARTKLAAFSIDPAFEAEHVVYVLAPAEWATEVTTRIREFAKGDYDKDAYRLKEATRLRAVLDGDKFTDRLGGWLELDNGFMFFTDKEMWEQTCKLFGGAT